MTTSGECEPWQPTAIRLGFISISGPLPPSLPLSAASRLNNNRLHLINVFYLLHLIPDLIDFSLPLTKKKDEEVRNQEIKPITPRQK